MTDVVAALIWNGEKFLACQRPAHKARGLLWEFVGGKVEPGEPPEDALVRECREELDVTVAVGGKFMEVIHEYPDLTVRLSLFNAVIVHGIPKMLEHNDIRWITTSAIPQYNFCPADKEILDVLMGIRNEFQAKLYALRDEKYKSFNSALIPTVDPERIIGVRIPELRKQAKNLSVSDLSPLPHDYYEEDCLHGILISNMTDPKSVISELDQFLPYIDNWAVCDLISPKAFKKRPPDLICSIQKWIKSDQEYTVRFAIGMLMKFYLDEDFKPEYCDMVAALQSDTYYVKMMIAWYFATALAKQPAVALPVLENRSLSPWVHNKTIQKAIESFRIPAEMKEYLKTLRIHREE